MGEHVSVDGQVGYARDPWEVHTGTPAALAPEARSACYAIMEEHDEHRLDPEVTLTRLMSIIGPSVARYLIVELHKVNGPLFLGLPPELLRKIAADQRRQLEGVI